MFNLFFIYLFVCLFVLRNFTRRTIDDKSQFHLLEKQPNSSSPISDDEFSPLNMDLMGDLQDVIFRNFYTVSSESDGASPSLKKPKVHVTLIGNVPLNVFIFLIQSNDNTFPSVTNRQIKRIS